MKILQVVKTNRGAQWAFNQAIHVKKLGVEVVTVLPDANDGYAAKYKEHGMEVITGDWSLPITKPWKFFARKKHIKQDGFAKKSKYLHTLSRTSNSSTLLFKYDRSGQKNIK